MNYVNNAGLFLIDTLLGLYILLVLLRFWLHWLRGDFRGPIGQLLINATSPVVTPFRSLAKSPKAWALICLGITFILTILKNVLMSTLAGASPSLEGLLLFSFGEVLKTSIYIFMACVFIRIIASWIMPHGGNPLMNTIYSLSEPLMAPARRLIPSFNNIDLSPIAIFIALNLGLILVVQPIFDMAKKLG